MAEVESTAAAVVGVGVGVAVVVRAMEVLVKDLGAAETGTVVVARSMVERRERGVAETAVVQRVAAATKQRVQRDAAAR